MPILDDAPTVPDWLGFQQPIGRKGLELSSSGGGTITPPVTGPGPGPGVGTLTAGGATASDLIATGPSDLSRAFQVADLTRRGLGVVRALTPVRSTGGGVNPDPTAPEAQQITASTAPSSVAAAADLVGPGADVAASSASEASGLGALDVVGPAVAAAGLGFGLSTIAGSNARIGDKLALAANEAGQAVANVAGLGIPAIVDEVIQLFGGPSGSQVFADLFGLGGGSYIPKRQKAGKEATADLSGIAASYQAAAASGDPAQALTALATPQGERGAVRSGLNLPPNAVPGLRGPVEWSALTPGQFSQVLDYFRANPDALTTSITGSGDVAYLNQSQAEQVAANAAQDARALIQFLINQPAPATPTAPKTTPPAAVTTTGPSRALGFATDLLTP